MDILGQYEKRDFLMEILMAALVADGIRPSLQGCDICIGRNFIAISCYTDEITVWQYNEQWVRREPTRIWNEKLTIPYCKLSITDPAYDPTNMINEIMEAIRILRHA
jgi:hypothetical protein